MPHVPSLLHCKPLTCCKLASLSPLCSTQCPGPGNGSKAGPWGPWYLFGEAIGGGGKDVRNEGAVFDVLIVTDDMHGVLAWLRGPVPHVARPVPLVVALDLGLRRALDGEACRGRGVSSCG